MDGLQGTRVYRWTWSVADVALRLFYRRVDGVDVGNLPSSGPVVLAANHPNYIIDALAIAVQTPRQIHFVAKGPLVDRYPLLSRFIRALGVVPVFRPEDGRARMVKNRASFAHSASLLESGGVICIFAEGESHAEREVRELRTGTARIVLEAEERNDYELNVRVVPVGLYFARSDRFFSDGVVVFGRALDTTSFREQHAVDPAAAVRGLTDAIQERLQQLTLHVPDPDWAEFAEQMRDLSAQSLDAEAGAESELREGQEIAGAAALYREADAEGAERFRKRVGELWARAEAWRRHAMPEADTEARRRGVLSRQRDRLALPFAALGFVYNAPPYLVVQTWSRLFVPSKEKRAFVKFLVGVPAFLAWYGLVTRQLARRWRAASLTVWLVGPPMGVLALRARAHRRRWLDAWHRMDASDDVRRATAIAEEQQNILEGFAVWRASYREVQAQQGSTPEPPAWYRS